MNLRRLLVDSLRDLTAAALVGVLCSSPVLLFVTAQLFTHPTALLVTQRYQVTGRAEPDGLERWLRAQPHTRDVQVRAHAAEWEVTYRRDGGYPPLRPALTDLGYGNRVAAAGLQAHQEYGTAAAVPRLLFPVILCTQFGFLWIGLRRLRASRRDGEELPKLFGGPPLPAVLLGILGGGVLTALGYGSDALMLRLVGPPPPSIWSVLSAVPLWAKIAIFPLGAVVAPACEEFFFRGMIDGRFRAAGNPVAGLLVSATLFSLAHLDAYNGPGIFVFGLVLALLYRRSGTLIAPAVAHGINNATVFALLLAHR